MAANFLSGLLSIAIFSHFSIALTPSPPTFSLDLYHRDFFEVKDHKSLQEAQLLRDAERASYMTSLLSGPAAPLFYANGEYLVSVLIGSPAVEQYLLVDTGNLITWWQCGPCEADKCYRQNSNPIYNSGASLTFHELDCTLVPSSCGSLYSYCNRESPRRCDYMISYGSGQITMGVMAYEAITFPITKALFEIVFGCGRNQKLGKPFGEEFAGIFGLGGGVDPDDVGRFSVPSQLKSTLFAFCLPSPSLKKKSWLYFNDVPQLPTEENAQAPIVRNDNLLFYYVQLVYIIVGYYKIDVQRAADWNGHLMVDSGTVISRIPRSIYNIVKKSIMEHMASHNLKPMLKPPKLFDLCYDGFYVDIGDFPTIELVFDSPSYANTLKLSKEQVALKYYRDEDVFCLAFFPSDTYSVLGNTQLYGTALTFDLSAMILTFSPNSCSS